MYVVSTSHKRYLVLVLVDIHNYNELVRWQVKKIKD